MPRGVHFLCAKSNEQVALRGSPGRLRLRFQKAGLGASMVGLEFRPESLPESLPLRQTRPRPRPDVNGHLLNQEGRPVAVRHQSVKPDRQVAAAADARR